MIELKPRLAAIAKHVLPDSTVIDIGTDHAYLLIALVQQGKCPKGVGVDVHKGPYLAALENVRNHNLSDKIQIYFGDGLRPLSPGVGDNLVVAGMGGTTIVDILEGNPGVLSGVRRMVLQPMVAGRALREWLITHDWAIVDEELSQEEGRIYEIIVTQPGNQAMPEEILLELGPRLVEKKDPLLAQMLDRKVQALEGVLAQMQGTQRPEVAAKSAELEAKINQMRRVLQ